MKSIQSTTVSRDLTQGDIARALLAFALPVLGTNVLQSLNGSINVMWVGNLLGVEALTATSNANLVLFLLLGVVFGVSMAVAILVGNAYGAGDIQKAKCVVGTGAAFFLTISTVVAVAGWHWTPSIIDLLKLPTSATISAVSYLRWIFVAVPIMNAFAFTIAVLRGVGDSRTPFFYMALSGIIDVALNPVLILGLGPLPALGIAGSAIAMLLAQTISFAALLLQLFRSRHPMLPRRHDLSDFRPQLKSLRDIVAKGVPLGLQMIVLSSAALVMIGFVNGYGVQVAAAYVVAVQLWNYVQMPALAIGAAVSSMAAQNIGAGRWDRVEKIARLGVLFNLLLTSLLVMVLLAAGRETLGLFLPVNSDAINMAMHINKIVGWSFVLFGVTMVLFGVVRAAGAVVPPLLILIVSLLVVRIPVAWGLRDRFAEEAIWWSIPLGAVISTVLGIIYYRVGNWRNVPMMSRGNRM